MIKTKADFDYSIDTISGHKIIVIVDANLGRMSVTNDIENVVASIELTENIDAKDYLVIYKDSTGRWDGWDGRDFISLSGENPIEAARKYIHLKEGAAFAGRKLSISPPCPKCGETLDAVVDADGGIPDDPKAGDFSVCAGCLSINIFDTVGGSLTIRSATAPEMEEFKKQYNELYYHLKSVSEKTPYRIKIRYFDGIVNIKCAKYGNGRVGLQLMAANSGEPVAVATVNIPSEELSDGEVIIKDYSENEGVLAFLQGEGIVGDVIREISTGYVKVPIVHLEEKILAKIKNNPQCYL